MHSRSHSLKILLAATSIITLASAACEPIVHMRGPGATGVVSLAEGVVLPDDVVEVHFRIYEDDGAFDRAELEESHTWMRTTRESLEGVTLPMQYEVGTGVGNSGTQDWRVVAWTTTREVELANEGPAETDLLGTTAFQLTDCGDYGFCDITSGVDVFLGVTD